jgi:hypothetical protein
MTVEELDELTMSNVANFAKSDRRRKPQSYRKTIVEFVRKVVSVKLFSPIRLVARLILEMIRD